MKCLSTAGNRYSILGLSPISSNGREISTQLKIPRLLWLPPVACASCSLNSLGLLGDPLRWLQGEKVRWNWLTLSFLHVHFYVKQETKRPQLKQNEKISVAKRKQTKFYSYIIYISIPCWKFFYVTVLSIIISVSHIAVVLLPSALCIVIYLKHRTGNIEQTSASRAKR